MTINETLRAQWNRLYEHGDFIEMEATTGISRQTLSNTFRSGEGTEATIIAIKNFYDAKQERLAPIIK